jgi:hypothetical protein
MNTSVAFGATRHQLGHRAHQTGRRAPGPPQVHLHHSTKMTTPTKAAEHEHVRLQNDYGADYWVHKSATEYRVCTYLLSVI